MKHGLMAALLLLSLTAYADETMSEKVQTTTDTANRTTKQTVRKSKKSVRDKTGHQDKVEDVKDTAKTAGEDVSDKTKEVKRQVD
jgi:hypothetical protein